MAYNSIEKLLESEERAWEYNFEYETYNEEYKKLESLDRYISYKVSGAKQKEYDYKNAEEFINDCHQKYKDVYDPDGSSSDCYPTVHEIYNKLWKWQKGSDTFGKINGAAFNDPANKTSCLFGADTMNSAQNPLSMFISTLKDDQKAQLVPRGKSNAISYLIECYCGENKEKFKKAMEIQLIKNYLEKYHTLGNFVLVPAYFNQQRGFSLRLCGGVKINDFWDMSLDYLQENGYGDFTPEYFTDYINYFFLWDYVENKNGKYEAKPIGMNNFSEKRDILKFLEESTENIKRRGKIMTAMLIIQHEKNELYKDIQEYLTGGEFWADSIFDAAKQILEQFNGKIPETAKKCLEELKEGIV